MAVPTLYLHAAATWSMVGLIWFVQVVHYPLFANVSDSFAHYEQIHQQRTTWVVAPLMLAELATAVVMVFHPAFASQRILCWLGLGLVVGIWLSTAFIQVPLHGILTRGHDVEIIRKLVVGNWLRTVLWTARGVIALLVLHRFYSVNN